MAASSPAKVSKLNDKEEAKGKTSNHRHKHEETISNLVNTKVKASSQPVYENLNNELPILHTAAKVHNPSGLTNSNDTEIDL